MIDAKRKGIASTDMEGVVRVTVCYSSEHEVIDEIELAYQTVWSDLEEMVNTLVPISQLIIVLFDQLLLLLFLTVSPLYCFR